MSDESRGEMELVRIAGELANAGYDLTDWSDASIIATWEAREALRIARDAAEPKTVIDHEGTT